MTYAKDLTPGTAFYHGTRAELQKGDLLKPGFDSNFTDGKLSWIYFSAGLEAATWGAELARGEGRERIYIVEPTGAFEDDPNLTDQRFPGNPTMSYRSREPRTFAHRWRGRAVAGPFPRAGAGDEGQPRPPRSRRPQPHHRLGVGRFGLAVTRRDVTSLRAAA
jgi:hypothetical protein